MAKFRDYLQRALQWDQNHVAPIITPSGTRINVTAGAASSAEAALPAGKALRIASDQPCWIRFGNTGVGAASAANTSMYFPAGVEIIGVPIDANGAMYDYVRAIRAGGTDAALQIEGIA